MSQELSHRLVDYRQRISVVNDSFGNVDTILKEQRVNGILLDLGFNSVHVDEAERGFSFQLDGPLDMRYDQSQGITASDLINGLDAQSLTAVFSEYSGESIRTCRRIAKAVVARRQDKGRFTSTKELASFFNHLLGGHKESRGGHREPRTTPCTGLFQSLRICVNNEFQHLDQFMSKLPFVLDHGGVFVALCFQSLEVKRLKTWMKWYSDEQSEWRKQHPAADSLVPLFTVLTPKPIAPTEMEVMENRRARSTLLYAIQRN